MRWNCPHCEELVTAGIDFESTTRAYVRCAHCNGMALIHRSAVLADYVKARRLEEEAQLESELEQERLLQARLTAQRRQMEIDAVKRIEEISQGHRQEIHRLQTQMAQPAPPQEVPVAAEMAIDGRVLRSQATPPPFPPIHLASVEEIPATITEAADYADMDDLLANTPAHAADAHAAAGTAEKTAVSPVVKPPETLRPIPVPPAFLIGNVEEVIRSFATEEAELPLPKDAVRGSGANGRAFAFLSPNAAVAAAAALAMITGFYLFQEGRKALKPAPQIEHVSRIPDAAHSGR